MNIEIDPDVKALAEFMQKNIPADRLVDVAVSIGRIAPILWDSTDKFVAMKLIEPPILDGDLHTQSSSIG